MVYLDELEAHELNNVRLTLKFQFICLNLQNQDNMSMYIGFQQLQEFISYLSQNKNKHDYIRYKLVSWYKIILPMVHGNGDPGAYLRYVEEYIEIGMGNIEDRDPLCQTINLATV